MKARVKSAMMLVVSFILPLFIYYITMFSYQEESSKDVSVALEKVAQVTPTYHVSRAKKKKKHGIYVKSDDADAMDVFDSDEDIMTGL